MIFTMTESGRIILQEVSDEAWMFLQSERQSVGVYDHWQFGKDRYDGTVYITTTEYEDKTEAVRLLDKLIKDYKLKPTGQSIHILNAWRREAQYAKECERRSAWDKAREKYIYALRNALKRGCKCCKDFQEELHGDDVVGLCLYGQSVQELESSTVSPNHGEWDTTGEHYWGRKYYPFSKCRYLSEEVK